MRFWLLVITVAVVGFGLGTGVAYGRHALKGDSPASPGPVATAPAAAPNSGQQPSTAAAALSPDTRKATPASQAPTPTAKPEGTAAPGRTGTPTGRPGAGQASRNNLTGTIESVAGDSLVLATRQGSATVALGRDTAILQIMPASRADLKPGVTVASFAAAAQGGAVTAVMIGGQGVAPTFLLAMGGGLGQMGGGLGQMGGGTGQRSAPVSGTVSQVSGDSVVVDTTQGQVTLTLGPDTVLQKVAAADRAALAAGSTVFVSGSPGASQSAWTATTVVIMPAPPARQP